MDTHDIRCFRRVYEEGSLNRAARQLFISPQGLSRVIQKLEEDLDAQLFDRTQKGMAPTECGAYLYQNSQALLLLQDEIEAGLRRIQSQSRQLNLGFSCGVLNVFPLHKLDELQNRLGPVPLRWDERDTEEVTQGVREGRYDAGFVIGQTAEPGLWARELYAKKLDAIVYEGHPLYGRESLSIGELQQERFVTLNEKFYSYHSFVQRCRDFGFTPQIVIKTMESPLIYRFCREGLGLGIDVDIHQSEVSLHGLRRVPLVDSIPWKIYLILQEERLGEKALQTVREVFLPSTKL